MTPAETSAGARPPAPVQLPAKYKTYWRKTIWLTGGLLGVWFVVTFVLVFFARSFSFKLLGWPFSFWVAGQGALIVYCLIIWLYAWRMNRLDAACSAADDHT